MSNHTPNSVDFQNELDKIFRIAQQKNMREISVKSGDLHRRVGGYPSRNHRMLTCCQVMRANMRSGDQILQAPLKGNGATLVIRYQLPRG
jgi:hypothetical protein